MLWLEDHLGIKRQGIQQGLDLILAAVAERFTISTHLVWDELICSPRRRNTGGLFQEWIDSEEWQADLVGIRHLDGTRYGRQKPQVLALQIRRRLGDL